jgi:hypothetical protein
MFGEEHARAVTRAWEIGQRFAMIPRVPDVGQLTWEHTLRS